MSFFSFLKPLGALLKKAFNLAVDAGLTNDIVDLALKWVRVAQSKFTEDAKKREFVVKMLVSKGIPEGIARIAVELAVRLLKRELDKLEEKY